MIHKKFEIRTGCVEVSNIRFNRIQEIKELPPQDRKEWIERISNFDDYWASEFPNDEYSFDTQEKAVKYLENIHLNNSYDRCSKLLYVEFAELLESEYDDENIIQSNLLKREWSEII